MSRFFLDLNEKREAIRKAQEQPRSWLQRLRQSVVEVVYRIRRPSFERGGSTAYAGATVHDAMADAARADLASVDLDWFGGERMSRAWMRHGNAAGVVAGSYEEEISQPTLYVVEGRRR